MKESQLTPVQSLARASFVEKLSRAGWDVGGWEDLFAGGVSLDPEAQAEYQNDSFDLRVSYHLTDGYVGLECTDRKDQSSLSFRFYAEPTADAIVDRIIAVQDTLSPENYPEIIKSIIPLCALVLLETENDLIRLSTGENDYLH